MPLVPLAVPLSSNGGGTALSRLRRDVVACCETRHTGFKTTVVQRLHWDKRNLQKSAAELSCHGLLHDEADVQVRSASQQSNTVSTCRVRAALHLPTQRAVHLQVGFIQLESAPRTSPALTKKA